MAFHGAARLASIPRRRSDQQTGPDFRAVFACLPGLYLVLSPKLVIEAASDAYLAATKTVRHSVVGRGYFEVFPDNPDDPNASGSRNLRASLERVRKHRVTDVMAYQKYDMRRPDNEGGGFEEKFWNSVNSPVLSPDRELLYIIHEVEDVTDVVQLEHQVTDANQFLRSILDSTPDPIFVKDREHRWIVLNDAFCAFIGRNRDELIGRSDYDFFPKAQADIFWEKDELVFTSGQINVNEESFTDATGFTHAIQTKKVPLVTNDGKQLIVGIIRDMTELKALHAELENQAHVDGLTGLANRRHFLELAELELARSLRYGNELSVLMLDIDHFKTVNDTHGHKIGDLVLQKLAKICHQAVREFDIIGRLGGEEFAILLPETAGDKALEVAERIRQSIAVSRVPLGLSQPLAFTASIGVATLTEKKNEIDALLNEADKALYEAKRAGRNKVCVGAT